MTRAMEMGQGGLNEVQAAYYLGCPSFSVFKRLRNQGLIPEPTIDIHGQAMWSRARLEALMEDIQQTQQASVYQPDFNNALDRVRQAAEEGRI